jgi:uncharacterized protein YbjT (DUF2867 family)
VATLSNPEGGNVKVILFGATGMVGQGVLRECLRDSGVTDVLAVGRRGTGLLDPKVTEIQHDDFTDFTPLRDRFAGYDACFFCLGISSVGLDEATYRKVTYDYTMAAARVLAEVNPGSVFIYVSGQGTDEHGRQMWARVKGKTETDLLALGLDAYMLRPGFIRPAPGVRSRTTWYRLLYAGLRPVYPVLRRIAPGSACTGEQLGQAMLAIARHGAPTRILDSRHIVAASLG